MKAQLSVLLARRIDRDRLRFLVLLDRFYILRADFLNLLRDKTFGLLKALIGGEA